mgnify:CR=1 FL=1|jgi:hypothetical protein
MSSTNYEDITINQGTDVAIEVHLVHDSGSAFDLTNRSVSAMMKRRYTDSANDPDTLQFNAVVATPPADGILTLSLTNAQTDALKPRGRYVYDVELSHTDSDTNTITQRILEGQIEVSPSVTK